MKNTVKNVMIAVLFVAFLSATFFACKENKQRAKAEKSAKENEKVLNDVITKPVIPLKDKNGNPQSTPEQSKDLLNSFAPFVDSVKDALEAAGETNNMPAKDATQSFDSLVYYKSVNSSQAEYIDSLLRLITTYATRLKRVDADAELERLKADSLASAKAKIHLFEPPYFLGRKVNDETKPSPLTLTIAAPSIGYYYRTGSTTIGAAAVITSGRFRMINSFYKYLNQPGVGGSLNISMEGFSIKKVRNRNQ